MTRSTGPGRRGHDDETLLKIADHFQARYDEALESEHDPSAEVCGTREPTRLLFVLSYGDTVYQTVHGTDG